jgi:hypothetical protein
MVDVKACFHFPCIHPDLTGTFGFLAGGYFNLATAMVFGSTASTSSWEPFRRAIQALSVIYAHCRDLTKKHRKFLDMISWATQDPASDLARVIPCSINILVSLTIKVTWSHYLFQLCFCNLYSSKRVYFIFLLVICKHKIQIFMFVGVRF